MLRKHLFHPELKFLNNLNYFIKQIRLHFPLSQSLLLDYTRKCIKSDLFPIKIIGVFGSV